MSTRLSSWACFFEKLGLPLEYTKKTKTGYSTAVDVLERLAPIARLLRKSWITVKLLRFNLLM